MANLKYTEKREGSTRKEQLLPVHKEPVLLAQIGAIRLFSLVVVNWEDDDEVEGFDSGRPSV
jgi:hypothetical protein